MKIIVNIIFRCSKKIFRKLFGKICNVIFLFSCWRNGIEVGKNVRTWKAVPILRISKNAEKIVFHDNVTFNNYLNVAWSTKCLIEVEANAKLIIGKNSGMSGGMIYCAESIIIGEYVNIGGGTKIYDTNFHSLNWKDRRFPLSLDRQNTKTAPVIIDDDVFIGANCIIGKGVHIGEHSIIAAGSVVVKDIPSNEVWGGNPAQFIKRINNN